MDTSSIITQVKAEDEEAKETSSTCNGGPIATLSDQDIAVHTVLKFHPEKDEQVKPVKKPRNRGILSSIFCCFGAHGSTSRLPTKNQEQTASLTAPNNQNTLTKGYEEDEEEPPSLEDDVSRDLSLQVTPYPQYLLPPISHEDINRHCAVIDLDETLVHSSFKPVQNPDFIVPVEIDGTIHQVYVLKRPFVDEFLRKMGELYECVLFTASLAKYADPVADLLDKYGTFRARLFRESCVFHEGNYVKDLSRLGRKLERVIIIDNSPASYIFHPENAVPVRSWFDDQDDRELLNLLPFMESLHEVDSCVVALQNNRNRFMYGSTSSYSSNGSVER